MRSPVWLIPVALVFGCVAVTCGGTVVVDHNSGEGGSGSSSVGPTTSITTGPTTTSVTTGPTTSVTTGPTTTTSTSTGTPTGFCDGTGDCLSCQDCALNGGPCSTLWNECLGDASCVALLECLGNCFDDACIEECFESYPEAQGLYQQLVVCVICDSCYSDCDGFGGGC
ncbi:MAG TPA: hypothetical protein VLS89_01800 [Candidatus Nanopelagicales bacterium]|nr:hypothetical protein [Candidatus Nanopelagicales bacterium]